MSVEPAEARDATSDDDEAEERDPDDLQRSLDAELADRDASEDPPLTLRYHGAAR